jgi:hypothetical protein
LKGFKLKLLPQGAVVQGRQLTGVDVVNHGSDRLCIEILNLPSFLFIFGPIFRLKHLKQNIRFRRHDILVTVEGLVVADDFEVGEGVVRQELLHGLVTDVIGRFGVRQDDRSDHFNFEDGEFAADVETAVGQEYFGRGGELAKSCELWKTPRSSQSRKRI